MTRILVATDGSDGANRAVDYAAHQAKSTRADLLIVNISGPSGLPDNIFKSVTRSQHAWLEELLTSLSAKILTSARDRARGIGVSMVQLESRSGDVAHAIIDIAQQKEADSIVVGKRGTSRVSGLLLGSVSQKLVSLSPIPVTVIP